MSIYKLNKPNPKHSNGTGYITRSGHTMFNSDIVRELQHKEFLEKENAKLSKALEHISTMCGNPSAVDACRLIANKCQEVLNEHRN